MSRRSDARDLLVLKQLDKFGPLSSVQLRKDLHLRRSQITDSLMRLRYAELVTASLTGSGGTSRYAWSLTPLAQSLGGP